MSEDTARAVGSNGTDDGIIINGKRCTVRALTLKELGEIERECLKRYKRTYLETFAENADLLPNAQQLIEKKLEEAAKWDVRDLPLRRVHDVSKVKVTDKLLGWVKSNYEGILEEDQTETYRKRLVQRVTTTALDNGTLSAERYESLTGSLPASTQAGYVNWWITATFDGQIEMIYTCFKHNDVTRDELCAELSKNPGLMIDASREIEHLTAPQVGNS